MERIDNLTYAVRPEGELLLDLRLPPRENGVLRPAIIFVHGGAWYLGNKSTTCNDWLVELGFVTASIDYRLTDVASFPAQIHDVKAAVRWLRAHADEYAIDPDQIGIWGSSAGGHLTALCAVTNGNAWYDDPAGDPTISSDIQCAVPICPPTDLLIDWYAVCGYPSMDDIWEALVALLGGPLPTTKELAVKASPLWQCTEHSAPQLFIHGDSDDVVPVGQVRAHVAALLRDHQDVRLLEIEGEGHGVDAGIYPENPDPHQLRPLIGDFFRKHLMPAQS